MTKVVLTIPVTLASGEIVQIAIDADARNLPEGLTKVYAIEKSHRAALTVKGDDTPLVAYTPAATKETMQDKIGHFIDRAKEELFEGRKKK